jgi:hypothetical protein
MTADLAIIALACAAWLNRAQDRRLRFLLVQMGSGQPQLCDQQKRPNRRLTHDAA